MNRRIGKFIIQADFVTNYSSAVKRAMGKCTILRAEYLFDINAFEYIAICDQFSICQEGMIAPTYNLVISDGQPFFALQNDVNSILREAKVQANEIETLRQYCNDLSREYLSQIKMLEQQNKSLLDQLVNADLLAPRTYVIELPNGATLLGSASKNGAENGK